MKMSASGRIFSSFVVPDTGMGVTWPEKLLRSDSRPAGRFVRERPGLKNSVPASILSFPRQRESSILKEFMDSGSSPE